MALQRVINELLLLFDDQPTSSTYLKNLSKCFNLGDMTPIMTPAKIDLTPLKGVPSTIKVAHFSIEAAIRSLLLDPMNQQTGNLILNPEDPFGKYIPSDENDIHEILSGSVYQDN